MSATDLSLDALRSALGGRYAIERELGRGGMGAVYLARDRQLDRPVAIKVLPADLASVADLRERFLRETRTAASFSHPNIVPVFSIEDHDGLLAFVMGFVEGESLAQRVQRSGPLSVRELVRLMQDVGYALAYAHGRGVVHRDIKPDNIMLERATGRALLMDFGISRTITTQAATPGLTRVGEVVGTPEFMSPEQAAGDTIDGRSDLYSLGLVTWFAATGELAISGESTQKIIVRQITETIPAVGTRRSDLPQALAATIDACLQKDPESRVADANALIEALDSARLAGPDVPLPIRIFAQEAGTSGLVALGGLATGVLLYIALGRMYQGNLDIILPVVVFGAALWGRLAQTVQMARRLALRGFSVDEIQRGFAGVLAERDADRAQLNADPVAVAKRRRQVVILLALFASTFAMKWWVWTYQRVLLKPDWYGVRTPGVIVLYSLSVIRGITVMGLVRSPLRRPIGEWLFRGVWLSGIGAALLRVAGRGVRPATSETAATRITRTGAALSAPGVPVPTTDTAAAPSVTARLDALERRIGSLEQRGS